MLIGDALKYLVAAQAFIASMLPGCVSEDVRYEM
jgi:hypothetical protein